MQNDDNKVVLLLIKEGVTNGIIDMAYGIFALSVGDNANSHFENSFPIHCIILKSFHNHCKL